MKEQDKIKASALKKYSKYVEMELKRLNDGFNDNCGLNFSEFKPEPPVKDNFTDGELKELSWHFENLNDPIFFGIFCSDNNIDLKNYPKIKGL